MINPPPTDAPTLSYKNYYYVRLPRINMLRHHKTATKGRKFVLIISRKALQYRESSITYSYSCQEKSIFIICVDKARNLRVLFTFNRKHLICKSSIWDAGFLLAAANFPIDFSSPIHLRFIVNFGKMISLSWGRVRTKNVKFAFFERDGEAGWCKGFMWWLHVDKNKITGRGRSWIRVACTKSFLRHPTREHSFQCICVDYEYQSSLLKISSFIIKINCMFFLNFQSNSWCLLFW